MKITYLFGVEGDTAQELVTAAFARAEDFFGVPVSVDNFIDFDANPGVPEWMTVDENGQKPKRFQATCKVGVDVEYS